MEWKDPQLLSAAERMAQEATMDYACVQDSCQNLLLTRPATKHFRVLEKHQCSGAQLPTAPATTTITSSSGLPATTEEGSVVGLDGSAHAPVDSDSWPDSWGVFHWLAVAGPLAVLLGVCCGLHLRYRTRRQKLKRVHVDPEDPLPRWNASDGSLWDLTQAGPITPEQIEAVEIAIAQAERQAEKLGHGAPRRRLALAACNQLGRGHFAYLARLLDKHPTVSVRLDLDWSSASDAALEGVKQLLGRRERCSFDVRRGRGGDGETILKLPMHASCAVLGDLAEWLSVGGHHAIDAVALGDGKPVMVSLSALRLSAQELTLSRQRVGDAGCAVACGFVRPWAGRLVAARFLECDVGDDGAAEIARLLAGGPKRARDPSAPGLATGLRELLLSANRIGDAGTAALADALPKCDSLERLLIDRNCIGAMGARALAQKVGRSNLRELVLGSHLGGNPIGPLGVEALAAVLDDELPRAAANRAGRLQALSLEDCGIGALGASALAAALPRSGAMALSVARGQIGDGGMARIMEALPPTLMSLDLAGNGLGDEAAILAGCAMRKMPTLSVSLAQNEISMHVRGMLREELGSRLRV